MRDVKVCKLTKKATPTSTGVGSHPGHVKLGEESAANSGRAPSSRPRGKPDRTPGGSQRALRHGAGLPVHVSRYAQAYCQNGVGKVTSYPPATIGKGNPGLYGEFVAWTGDLWRQSGSQWAAVDTSMPWANATVSPAGMSSWSMNNQIFYSFTFGGLRGTYAVQETYYLWLGAVWVVDHKQWSLFNNRSDWVAMNIYC